MNEVSVFLKIKWTDISCQLLGDCLFTWEETKQLTFPFLITQFVANFFWWIFFAKTQALKTERESRKRQALGLWGGIHVILILSFSSIMEHSTQGTNRCSHKNVAKLHTGTYIVERDTPASVFPYDSQGLLIWIPWRRANLLPEGNQENLGRRHGYILLIQVTLFIYLLLFINTYKFIGTFKCK